MIRGSLDPGGEVQKRIRCVPGRAEEELRPLLTGKPPLPIEDAAGALGATSAPPLPRKTTSRTQGQGTVEAPFEP